MKTSRDLKRRNYSPLNQSNKDNQADEEDLKPSSTGGSSTQHMTELQILCCFLLIMITVISLLVLSKKNISPYSRLFREIMAGGVSACIASFIFFPLSVVNIRLQTSSSIKNIKDKKIGVFKMINIIFMNEGLEGLYCSGIVANCCRGFLNQGLRLGLFPTLKEFIIISLLSFFTTKQQQQQQQHEHSDYLILFIKVLAGMITGGLSAFLCSPFDLAEVLMNTCKQNKNMSSSRKYANTIDALSSVKRREGFCGLWRASKVTTVRAALASGAQLAYYDSAKSFTRQYLEGPAGYFIPVLLSIGAAVSYSIVAAPIDLIKVRMMALKEKEDVSTIIDVSSDDDNKSHKKQNNIVNDINLEKRSGQTISTLQQVRAVIQSEGGVLNLWRGLWPVTLRLIPVVILVFPLMEYMKTLLGVGS